MASCTYGKTLLKIENVSLEYDGRPILKKVSAEIKDIIRPDCRRNCSALSPGLTLRHQAASV